MPMHWTEQDLDKMIEDKLTSPSRGRMSPPQVSSPLSKVKLSMAGRLKRIPKFPELPKV